MTEERTPLVLLCGLLCDRLVWDAVAERLADVAETTIISFAGCTSIGEMAGKVLADAPPQFSLAGHSMGGRVALEVYRRAPDRITRLALLNTGVHGVSEAEVPGRQRLLDLAASDGIEAVMKEWLPPMVGEQGRANEQLMSALAIMVCSYTPGAFTGQIQALLNRPDAESILPTVTVPTLLLSSDEDRWSPVSQHAEMQSALPGSTLVAIENAGHMSTVEAPDAVAHAMREWLAR